MSALCRGSGGPWGGGGQGHCVHRALPAAPRGWSRQAEHRLSWDGWHALLLDAMAGQMDGSKAGQETLAERGSLLVPSFIHRSLHPLNKRDGSRRHLLLQVPTCPPAPPAPRDIRARCARTALPVCRAGAGTAGTLPFGVLLHHGPVAAPEAPAAPGGAPRPTRGLCSASLWQPRRATGCTQEPELKHPDCGSSPGAAELPGGTIWGPGRRNRDPREQPLGPDACGRATRAGAGRGRRGGRRGIFHRTKPPVTASSPTPPPPRASSPLERSHMLSGCH